MSEKVLNGEKYGIISGTDITVAWNRLLSSVSDTEYGKTIILQHGTYYLSAENSPEPTLFITNTIGDNEWKKNEKPHRNRVATLIYGIDNLTVDGSGSTFVLTGRATNLAIINCKNIIIKNLTFSTVNPDMHELKVVGKGLNYVDFETDKESRYEKAENRFFFVGDGYRSSFSASAYTAHWIGKINDSDTGSVIRVNHPLLGAYSVKEKSPGLFRARYFLPTTACMGDRFYLFDVRRKYQGIIISHSKNIEINNVEQNFNYGLAVVCQATENFKLSESRFRPPLDGAKLMASVADFVQICMCRGKVEIKNCLFEGSGDDCLNVHGIHFLIEKAAANALTLKFGHPQTHGFCPFEKGDEIRYINPKTLLVMPALNTVKSARLIDEYTVAVDTNEPVKAKCEFVVENASACPDVEFCGNTVNRIITRGVLLTTCGKTKISGNKFQSTSMHSILISDDAKSWYESGFVRDVEISDNEFGRCIGYNVCIKPENGCNKGFVHKNIHITNNVSNGVGGGGIFVKSAEKVSIYGNVFKCKSQKMKIKNSDVLFETRGQNDEKIR